LLSAEDAAALPSRIHGTTNLGELADRSLVMEVVPERAEIKRAVYAALEQVLEPSAIIASNTSGLMPSMLAAGMQHPERFVVAHFWNPPHAIPLVEVVPGPATASETLAQTVQVLRAIGQKPVVMQREIPGFIGNRLQYALLREALAIVRSGAASAAEVDAVMRASLGRRYGTTGPFETVDLGGVNTFLSVAEHLMPQLAKDEDVLDLLRAHVAAGEIGLSSGQGFYAWPPERVAAVRGRRDRDLLRRRREDRESGA
jgi:3-hydroxybutyryl-CoA dehydrogenase